MKIHKKQYCYYWAYGSNMNQEQMVKRCPSARLIGRMDVVNLEFSFRAYADVVPKEGAITFGLLWCMCVDDLTDLDTYEGMYAEDCCYNTYDRLTLNTSKYGNVYYYQMTDWGRSRKHNTPSWHYEYIIRAVYEMYGVDQEPIDNALNEAISYDIIQPIERIPYAKYGKVPYADKTDVAWWNEGKIDTWDYWDDDGNYIDWDGIGDDLEEKRKQGVCL